MKHGLIQKNLVCVYDEIVALVCHGHMLQSTVVKTSKGQ